MPTFLIIDDRREQLHFFADFLKKKFRNPIIFSALQGEEGFKIALREQPDLILLDAAMPEPNGIDILKRLKETPETKEIPVIVFSSVIDKNQGKFSTLLSGGDYFIASPEDIKELFPQIISLLRRRGVSFFLPEEEKSLEVSTVERLIEEEVRASLKREDALKDSLKTIHSSHEELKNQKDELDKNLSEKEKILIKLKESEEKFRFLFHFATDYFLLFEVTDEDIKLNDINQSLQDKLGYSPEELKLKSFYEFYTDPPDKVRKFILKSALKKEGHAELNHRCKDGSIFVVNAKAKFLQLRNKNFIYVSERDITEERKLISQLKLFTSIVEQSPLAVIITNTEGKIEFINKGFSELTGFTLEEIADTEPNIFTTEEINKEGEIRDILKGGDIWVGEYKDKKKNGEDFWAMVVAFPVSDESDVLSNFALVLQDITSQKEMIEELRAAKAEAEKANKLKTEFLARISHEIRTPLNTIVNFSQLLLEEFGDTASDLAKTSGEAIERASKRLIRTIGLILDEAKIESGNIDFHEEIFDLEREILQPLLREYSLEATQKNIEIKLNSSVPNPLLKADRYMVHQIFANLLDNAVKFTNSGKIVISLYKNEKQQLSVEIEDTGIGIAPDYLNEIFEPFTQEEPGFSRRFEGAGLGMTLVKKYCELNKAEIKIESQKGKGTKVTVTFTEGFLNT